MERDKKSGVIGVIITIIILILLVIFTNTNSGHVSIIENIANTVVVPVENGLTYLKNKLNNNNKFFENINDLKSENEQLKEKDRMNALEEEMDMYGLDDDEKELVRKGEYDPWDFDPDNPTDEDDYYKDDLDYDNDDDEY